MNIRSPQNDAEIFVLKILQFDEKKTCIAWIEYLYIFTLHYMPTKLILQPSVVVPNLIIYV